MDANSPQRRYAYKKNGLFIETLSDSPVMNNRSTLPAIRGSTPQTYYDSPVPLPITQQSQILAIPTKYNQNAFSSQSLDFNSIAIQQQQRVQQLELRMIQTENSNRALVEEISRLQNELAGSLRRSIDTVQEERMARQQLETSYRYQYDNFVQMSNRLARAEESILEGRNTVQSLVMQTKSLEQTVVNTQKDVFMRKDVQHGRLDELKSQIDDLSRSKENLERSAYSLIDEIKTLKSKVDIESLNFNSLSSDLRNKTRRLEDENRQQDERFRKQQDTVSLTENNIYQVKSQLESRLSELKDLTNELRSKLDREKEERRSLEQHFISRYDELGKLINDDRLKFTEIIRTLESMKRDQYQNFEIERTKISSLIKEAKDSAILHANDKLERLKDETIIKFRDLEKTQNDENEQRKKIEHTIDLKLISQKKFVEDEIKIFKNEFKINLDGIQRNADAIKRLNEGLDLIEQNNSQSIRQLEKVVLAEIKLRKQCDRDFEERLDTQHEKCSHAIGVFQETLGTFSARINNQKDTTKTEDAEKTLRKIEDFEMQSNLIQTRIDDVEKRQDATQNQLALIENENVTNKETLKNIQITVDDMLDKKLRDINDMTSSVHKEHLDKIDEKFLKIYKNEIESQVKEELKKNDANNKPIIGNDEFEHEINTITTKLAHIQVEVENMNRELNKKILNMENELKNRPAQKSAMNIQNDYNAEWKSLVDENIDKLKEFQHKTEDELNSIEAKLNVIKNENKKSIENETRKRIDDITKLDIRVDKLEKPTEKNGNRKTSF